MKPPHQASGLLEGDDRHDEREPAWITVTGGKGGVGKTLVAVNLAVLAARSGYRTLLVDLDPGLANVGVHLRLASRWTVEDLARGECKAADALLEGPCGVRVLAGKSGSTWLATADFARHRHVVETTARAGLGFDLVVCDTGAGIGPAVIEAARRATLLLGVTTPGPAAVTDLYALCKVLLRAGFEMPRILVNRARSRDEAMRTASRLTSVCERFLGVGPPFAGWLRQDPALQRSIVEQRPFSLDGGGPTMEDLRALAANVLSCFGRRRRRRDPTLQRPGR